MSDTQIELQEAAQTKPAQPLSRSLFVGVAAAALALGAVIYLGIHERAMAASNLGSATERAATSTVTVVRPKSGGVLEEIVLPGNTQAFSDTPIFARTNGYLKRWYADIGKPVKAGCAGSSPACFSRSALPDRFPPRLPPPPERWERLARSSPTFLARNPPTVADIALTRAGIPAACPSSSADFADAVSRIARNLSSQAGAPFSARSCR